MGSLTICCSHSKREYVLITKPIPQNHSDRRLDTSCQRQNLNNNKRGPVTHQMGGDIVILVCC